MDPTCSGCCFSVWDRGLDVRRCRRWPPTCLKVGNIQDRAWPTVRDDDFCGEFKPKGDEQGDITLDHLKRSRERIAALEEALLNFMGSTGWRGLRPIDFSCEFCGATGRGVKDILHLNHCLITKARQVLSVYRDP